MRDFIETVTIDGKAIEVQCTYERAEADYEPGMSPGAYVDTVTALDDGRSLYDLLSQSELDRLNDEACKVQDGNERFLNNYPYE